jgi:hypothetical protein
LPLSSLSYAVFIAEYTLTILTYGIPKKLYKKEKWGTKAEYKRERKVSFAAMNREIDRGKISVQVDAADLKVKINFVQADITFGFIDSGLFN